MINSPAFSKPVSATIVVDAKAPQLTIATNTDSQKDCLATTRVRHDDKQASLPTSVAPNAPVAKSSPVPPATPVQVGAVLGTQNLDTSAANGALLSLNATTVAGISDASIDVPHYPRQSLKAGVVHFGISNFWKSHMAVLLHQLMNSGKGAKWGVVGVGLTKNSPGKRDVLAAQDNLFTVVERSAEANTVRIVGALMSYLTGEEAKAIIAQMASPETHIVSMTVTGDGYFFDENTGKLDVKHPDIKHDLMSGGTPRTMYGLMAAALKLRRQAGLPPFTVLSCDNMPNNGDRLRDMLVSFIKATHRKGSFMLADWVQRKGGFPNTMVDRIVPGTTNEDIDFVARLIQLRDAAPNVTEDFIQLVVEDKFSNGRPKWEDVGVLMAAKAEPYGTMKQRLLNASHSELAYLGLMLNQVFVYEAMGDDDLKQYINLLMKNELPLIPDVPGIDLPEYCKTLLKRFANPANPDVVFRLCRNGSGKIPKFILASVKEHLANGTDVRLQALTVAAWMRYLTGVNEQGKKYDVVDPKAEALQKLALEGGNNPDRLLQDSGVFSKDLQESEVFVSAVREALAALYKDGARQTLQRYIQEAQAA